ncbi:MAG: exodeoxyribonuclease III [Alphaproteobacteria bacterium]|nr:exodeoxyribonuclease III [Alphaproteobacteria bacterium]
MKIATWNVNSIKARMEHVKTWLQSRQPDVLMIQELKGLEFSDSEFKALGYQSVAESQKAYNGVAVLSRHPINVIQNILPGDKADDQARYLEVETKNTRLINIYLPNGNPVETEKFTYKLSWMQRLKQRLQHLKEEGISFAVGGDFNVIPEPRDCYSPKAWQNDALFRIETRQKFRELLNLGLTDAFRVFNQDSGEFTFWDYQAGAWQNGNGIRIDHFLLSPELADRLVSCTIDKEPRGWDKPSDHTPVIIEIES